MKEIQILNNGDALYDIRRKINENFELVHNEATTEPLVSFGVNEGNETNGVADLIEITDDTLNFKVGGEYPNLVITSGDGVTTRIENVNPLYLQNLADGEYTVLVDGSNSTITDAEFYSQLLEPENVNEGDVWFNGESAKRKENLQPTLQQLSGTGLNLNILAKLDNYYLAVSSVNTLYTSEDNGVTWTQRTKEPSGNASYIGCVPFKNEFYLLTTDRQLYRINKAWQLNRVTSIYEGDSVVPAKLLTYNNKLFALAGGNYVLYTTTNENYWSRSVIRDAEILRDIVFANEKYYVFDNNGKIFVSTDLEEWTTLPITTPAPSCAKLYGDKIIVGCMDGSLCLVNLTDNTVQQITAVKKQASITDIHVLQDNGVLIVGYYGLCAITYDLSNFTQLLTTDNLINAVEGEFIVGSAGIHYKIQLQTSWVPYPYIPIGELTISGGEVTYFTTYPYNTNGLFEATTSTFGLLRTAAEPDELNCHCQEAVLTPANLYNLNNYRTMNTSYEVDQKVGCPYHHNLQLNCIQAGTTSNEGLNTKGLLEPGTTIEDGTVIWEVQELGTAGGGLPMFAHIWSDHIYKDASYLRADTFSWQDGRIYKTGYEILEGQYDNEDSVIEVEDGITYKRTPDGFKIADETQQDAIRSLYETKGIAWIYVIDKANKRFKLPREKAEFATRYPSTLPVAGNGIALGMTNGTEYFAPMGYVGASNGPSTLNPTTSAYGTGVGHINSSPNYISKKFESIGITEDATKSGIEAQVTGIQTERINTNAKKYLYFYVGAYKRPETEIEVGKLTEVLVDKVDTNAGNLTAEGKSLISGYGMPSNRYIDLTLGASETRYTAPANGWFIFSRQANANNQFGILSNITSKIENGMSTYQWGSIVCSIPAKKGDIVQINYNAAGELYGFKFTYTEGEI